MQDRDERWVNGKGHEVIWRLVYHPGDLDTASYPARYALAEGIEAAREQGIEYSNRDRRLIGEVLDAYGRATDAGGKPFFGRCELSHTFAEVCRFTFQPKQAEPS